jgi:uncharacterized protein (DUF983 family)
MISKESVLYSILGEKCPRCHEGDLFVYKNPYHKLAFRKMHSNCSVCGQPSEPEPGFYQGAMYASYGVSAGISFLAGGLLLLTNLSAETVLIILSVLLLILLPWIFRVSRMIWLNIFVGYKPEKIDRRIKSAP